MILFLGRAIWADGAWRYACDDACGETRMNDGRRCGP